MKVLILLPVTVLLLLPVHARYSGGSGTADDPYEIATAADLIALGETPGDYDKHFILTADIDLDPNLPGGQIFDGAVISHFFGTFDGDGHEISHLTIAGDNDLGLFGELGPGALVSDLGATHIKISGSGAAIGGLAGSNYGHVTRCHSGGRIRGTFMVGGLVGFDHGGLLTRCWSSVSVDGETALGGLVGVNDGGDVTHCHATGSVSGQGAVGGLVGDSWTGTVAYSYSSGSVSGEEAIGGLVGSNWVGDVTYCYSSGPVTGDHAVGGLAGYNLGEVYGCYGTSTVSGKWGVGGLVGRNDGDIRHCYSVGAADGGGRVGGLAGAGLGDVTASFWDTETSGRLSSAGGTGKATGVMQTADTYLAAGWDFVGETANGIADVWRIADGLDYPELVPQFSSFSPSPADGAIDLVAPVTLKWLGGQGALYHDVYFGEDEAEVANATADHLRVYRGRQTAEGTTYRPADLEVNTTYYWRVDEVNEADPNSPWRGSVWRFTTANFVVVDDFESYDDEDNRIFETWLDGWFNGTGSMVGDLWLPFGPPVHSGQQSMPMYYDNTTGPYYSEASRTWAAPQDWTAHGMDTLTLYVRGRGGNDPSPLYVAIEDSAGQIAVAVHPDPNVVLVDEWIEWNIPFSDLVGVNPATIRRMYIGVGDRDKPQAGGNGRICIDDIRVTQAPVPPEPELVVVDDFESYTDESPNRVYETWVDGLGCSACEPVVRGNGTGSILGHWEWWVIMETQIVHSGRLSVPVYYDNESEPWYSEIERRWETPQDWTAHGMDTLTLYVRGAANKGGGRLYVAIQDNDGRIAVVVHPDPNAVLADEWVEWNVPFSDLAGVNSGAVTRMYIGVGDREKPEPGGAGLIYIDDILVRKRIPALGQGWGGAGASRG